MENNIFYFFHNSGSQSVIRIVLLGNDAFVNSFLQSYVECLASRPREYTDYFRFYFIPLGILRLIFECLYEMIISIMKNITISVADICVTEEKKYFSRE